MKLTRLAVLVTSLLLVAHPTVQGDDSEILSVCRRYLNATGNEQEELAARIDAYQGDVAAVIAQLAASQHAEQLDVSGVLLNQHFTDPRLLATHPEDLLHFFVPDNYHPDRPFGLLIFMHGGGRTTPRDHATRIVTDPETHPGSLGLQRFFHDLPFIIVAPSAPWNEQTGARWNVPDADRYIEAVIDECCHRFHVDRNRIFLGGYSMGAFGAWHLCPRLSDRLAGAVMVSGAWKTMHWKAWTGLPAFIRHGINDAHPETADGTPGRPRYTDVFYSRVAHQRLNATDIAHVYVEDHGGHVFRTATDAMSRLAAWIQQPRRDPFARRAVAISPRGWRASDDSPTPHHRWITIHETGKGTINFDRVVLDGPRPTWQESPDDFAKQSFRIEQQPVKAGLVDASIDTRNNNITVTTENVTRFSIWLHPAMIDFDRPVHVSVNGTDSVHSVQERLLTALQSYPRRHDWSLVYHAEIPLHVAE